MDKKQDNDQPKVKKLKQLFSVTEVAKIKGVSRPAVLGAIRTNRLPAERVGEIWVIRGEDLALYEPCGPHLGPRPMRLAKESVGG